MEAYGGDVAAVVKELNLKSVILIGHSMGGGVIFKAARQLPGRVKGLVAVDTYEDFSTWYTAEIAELKSACVQLHQSLRRRRAAISRSGY